MTKIYRVNIKDEYRKAGPTDLIQLLPVPGEHPLFVEKAIVESIVYAIVSCENMHVSGPTGSCKSSLFEALYLVPDNFKHICNALGYPVKKLKVYPIEMATYEAPGELYYRRALKDGTTYDEKSGIVKALEECEASKGKYYPLIWLREIGRVHSASVQGGLLNLMTRGNIVLPSGATIDGQKIAWVADSNYQAEQDSTHVLVVFDTALKARFSINITLDYLTAEQELQVLENIYKQKANNGKFDSELAERIVKLGNTIRRYRMEGNLQSVVPPTIYGYLAMLRMAQSLPHLSVLQVALATLLGNASVEDSKHVKNIFNEVFGLQAVVDDDTSIGGDMC